MLHLARPNLGWALASDHKYLRFCDLCKERAFGAQRASWLSRSSYTSFAFKRIMPPVSGESPTLDLLPLDSLRRRACAWSLTVSPLSKEAVPIPKLGSSVPKLGILLLLLRPSFKRTSTLRGCSAELPHGRVVESFGGKTREDIPTVGLVGAMLLLVHYILMGVSFHGFACAIPFGNKSD